MIKRVKFILMCQVFVILLAIFSLDVQAVATFEQISEENNGYFTTCTSICATELQHITTKSQKTDGIIKNPPTLTEKTRSDDRSTDESLPDEYGDFIDSLPDGVADKLPDSAFSSDSSDVADAAHSLSGAGYLLGALFDSFGASLGGVLPTLSLLCGIVILSAVCRLFAANLGGLSAAVSFATRLFSYCAIAASTLASISRLSDYFDSLFAAVASFVPLTAVLYASGGNLTQAASGTVTLGTVLSVCQLVFTKTVIPVFSVCLSMSMLSAFDGAGGVAAQSIAATVKKWYTTALAFVMMILTTSLAAQSIISVKADNAAMKGMKFAASSFIPVSGGAVSSTLGTLASSVELMRGSVGIVGVAVILLLLIPTVVELAMLRLALALAASLAAVLGCPCENRLLSEIDSLYGFLEGVAALSAVVFIVAFAIFASTCSAVG